MTKKEAIQYMDRIVDWLEFIEPIERGNYEFTEKAKEVLEYIKSSVSEGVLEQFKWERDVCLEQLDEIGKTLGSKMDDIVALLPKEAHIMTLDEIRNLQPFEFVWYEACDFEIKEEPFIWIEQGVVVEDELRFNGSYANLRDITIQNKPQFKERYWSSKPTEGQRECAPW